jgi:anti-sigma-K factor RskA
MIDDQLGDMTAAELALGVLEGRDREQAEARLAADPAFARDVRDWSDRLAPLLDRIAPVTPPATLLAALLRRIALPQPANDDQPRRDRQLTVWRTVSGLSTALAASLALAMILRPAATLPAPPSAQPRTVPTAPAPLVAALGAEGSKLAMVARFEPSANELLLVSPDPVAAPAAHDLELWIIPAGGSPVSLGVMRTRSWRRILPDRLAPLLRTGATLAVTVEAPGGSPNGKPTTDPIAAGTLDQS